MMPEDQNVKQWISKVFDNDKLTNAEIISLLGESSEYSQNPIFYYELAKVNSEAAFFMWQTQQQARLQKFVSQPSIEFHITTTRLVPELRSAKILYLSNGKAFLQHGPSMKSIEKPLAFRKLGWKEIVELGKETFSYSESALNLLLNEEMVYVASIIAGAKYKSYKLAVEYSSKRSQGGRAIKNWSSIQSILSELYLSVNRDESLVKNLNLGSAFLILKDADDFVSLNMQVLGGAGYTEDYIVERLYRECIFLKNWPKPFRQELINHYLNHAREL